MKRNRIETVLILLLNAAGIVCLVYFGTLYLTHDTTVPYPEAMLRLENWDRAGMALTAGFLPLVFANTLAFRAFRAQNLLLRLCWFLPGLFCGAAAAHYWITSVCWLASMS